MISTYTLQNGVAIPAIGLGTFDTKDEHEVENTLRSALEIGYRSLDCAFRYNNQDQIGRSLKNIDFPREELFITSKLWPTHKGYQSTKENFAQTLKDLQLDYLDLFLIHWPIGANFKDNWQEINAETWKAMEELYEDGKIRAIGVSNFLPHHLKPLIETAKIIPMVDQLEFHPGYPQKEAVDFCQTHNILVEAWSPLGRGRIFDSALLQNLAKKYGKTLPQICLRWALEKGICPLPKSVTPSRLKENLNVFDFKLSPEDILQIDQLPEEGFSGQHPDHVEF